jgi:protoporphyrinogen oxidase
MATVLLYLKATRNYVSMEHTLATAWVRRYMGERAYQVIWEPLFRGKFHQQADSVMLPWFWARIKKRTQSLLYPVGGFTAFLNLLAQRITGLGGEISLATAVTAIQKRRGGGYLVSTATTKQFADQIIYTGPTVGFPFLFGQPLKPKRKPHNYLTAQVIVLRLKRSFLKHVYWLNGTDLGYPFLVLVDHTNFVSSKHYANEHLVYVGNYLPTDHPYLTKKPGELLRLFHPYLDKIKPGYRSHLIGYDVFTLPYAQAVVDSAYVSNMRKRGTGLPGVYMANIDSVYPWDRGTNYAIEKGEELARTIQSAQSRF